MSRAAAVSLADYRTHVTMLKAAFTDLLTWSSMLKRTVAPGEQKSTINVTYIRDGRSMTQQNYKLS